MRYGFSAAVCALAWACAVGAADFSREIAEVKDGTRDVAHASWWGFDAQNATRALQAAIDSGAPTVVVDDTGHEWIVDPIRLRGNLELVVGENVTIRANPAGFQSKFSYLFSAINVRNLTLRGEPGAVLKMNRADYQDAARYEKSEWRHALNLLACDNAVIRDLRIEGSGGDGIYLGVAPNRPGTFCRDVLLENLVLADHHRQGISVISAENLTIRKVEISGTRGAPPECGLDFEPNRPDERIVNCVVENSVFRDNASDGTTHYFAFMNAGSIPVSITYRDCVFEGNRKAMSFQRQGPTSANPCTGNIEFIGCRFAGSREKTVELLNPGAGFPLVFRDCVFDNTGVPQAGAIDIGTKLPGFTAVGGVEFVNARVIDDRKERAPLTLAEGKIDPPVQGTLTFNDAPYDLEGFMAEQREARAAFQRMALATVDTSRLRPPAEGEAAPGREREARLKFRHAPTMLLWGEPGREIKVTLTPERMGATTTKVAVALFDPAGKALRREEWDADGAPRELVFTPTAAGIHRVEGQTRWQTLTFHSDHRGQGMLMQGRLQLLAPEGKIYFRVPAGAEEVAVMIWGDPNEKVTASLVNAKGRVMQAHENFDEVRTFVGKRPAGMPAEIWSIDFYPRAFEDVSVQLMAPIIPVIATNPNLLLDVE